MSIQFRKYTSLQAYLPIFKEMREFTQNRTSETADEVWFLEHEAVFTQGLAGKKEHVLAPGNIPVIQSDRGGQVTYHGPNQLMIYTLFDLKRLDIGIKAFVTRLESSIIDLLALYNIKGHTQCGAPGVYVENAKICSIGLRVTKGKTYHGLCLNVSGDLEPFSRINPCGYQQLKMTKISDFLPDITIGRVIEDYTPLLVNSLNQYRTNDCGASYEHA